MLKNSLVWLTVIIIALAASVHTYAALPPRARHATANPVPAGDGQSLAVTNAADEDDAPGGHGGHHGGGHHSSGHHGGGHHGGHSHHSYHSPHGHHHYATHYHHYHHHYHSYHGDSDYATWSIIFDVLGLIPIGIFSLLGVIFGIAGIVQGKRRRLARTGMIIGILEIVALVVLAVVLNVL